MNDKANGASFVSGISCKEFRESVDKDLKSSKALIHLGLCEECANYYNSKQNDQQLNSADQAQA